MKLRLIRVTLLLGASLAAVLPITATAAAPTSTPVTVVNTPQQSVPVVQQGPVQVSVPSGQSIPVSGTVAATISGTPAVTITNDQSRRFSIGFLYAISGAQTFYNFNATRAGVIDAISAWCPTVGFADLSIVVSQSTNAAAITGLAGNQVITDQPVVYVPFVNGLFGFVPPTPVGVQFPAASTTSFTVGIDLGPNPTNAASNSTCNVTIAGTFAQ